MVLKRNAVARWVLAASLLVAGSCAPASQGNLVNPAAPYDAKEAEKTLAFGFGTIVERHLERFDAAAIALEGMHGLATLDPEISVMRIGDRITLSAPDRRVAEYPVPAADDVDAWARLTVTVALDARTMSAAVRDAPVEKIYEAVFDATLSKLDVFSRYAGAKEARDHRAARNGFGGIGIKYDLAEGGAVARITEVMEESPAGRAGFKVGDTISRIDGEPVSGLDKDGISSRLRGSVGSDIHLTVAGASAAARQVTLHRALIVPETVTASIHDGYAEFKISNFNQRTASSLATQLKAARTQLGAAIKGVVLDLRGNPGGLLDQAVQAADLFIADGPIVWTKGRHPLASQSYEARRGDIGEDLPVVVLVDGRSASAAEILAGALEDAGRAVVIGTNSYGKGTVQTVIRLPNDGEMTLTWSRFYTPSGYALHGLGVLPTICTFDSAIGADTVVDGLVHATVPAPVTARMAQWRTAKLEDTDLRKQLRSSCPAARHADSPVEMQVAERLLGDHAVFGQALALSAPSEPPVAGKKAPVAAGTAQQVLH